MTVDITTQPPLRAAAVRHVGPYDGIPEAFARLGDIAGRAGLFQPGALMLGVYHDDPRTVAGANLRSDAAVTVASSATIPEGLMELVIPGGRYVRTTHVGPYTDLGNAWSLLMDEWLPRSGERAAGTPSYELYRNNPTNAKPHELITELYVPLA